MGARSFFDETDGVVASGGDFGEPEMSGLVGSGCAEVGSQRLFHLKPSQCFFRTVGLNAGNRANKFLGPRRSS